MMGENMARTCIYCGRSLADGERCTCRPAQERAGAAGSGTARTTGATGTAGTAGADGAAGRGTAGAASASGSGRSASGAGQTGGRPAKGRQQPAWQARWQAWRREQKRQQEARRQQAGPAGGERPFSRGAGKVPPDFLKHLPTVLDRLLRASRYVLRPADAIRLSVQYPQARRTYGFLGFIAVMAGLVFMSAIRNPQIALISGSVTTLPGILVLLEGMALGVSFMLLLALFYRLAFRFLHRRAYPYQAVFKALSPVALYGGLALMLVFMSFQASLFSGLTLLAAGLGYSQLIQYFVIRQLANLDENNSAVLVLIANLLCLSAMGVILSLF